MFPTVTSSKTDNANEATVEIPPVRARTPGTVYMSAEDVRGQFEKAAVAGMTEEASALLQELIDHTRDEERERFQRRLLADGKAQIIAQEALKLPPVVIAKDTHNNNPRGFNAGIARARCMIKRPFATQAEHDKFMMHLIQWIQKLKEMGTNDGTNNAAWVLEGREVGAFADAMLGDLFEESTVNDGPQDGPKETSHGH